jgi:phospholipid/cholesterol/gamma-HCH transport system substrate-binding protein
MTLRRLLPIAVLLALATLAAACTGGGNKTFEIELARTHNLFVDSPVKVMGVEVGRVAALDVAEGQGAVVATVRVDADVDVPADATAKLVQGTVLGERFIQLDPPYTQGERLEDGATIPMERTRTPAEFDELLSSLEEFLGGLPADEVDRFIVNVAEILAGRGDQLGTTLEATSDMLATVRANDDELVSLLVGVADFTETLASRDAELRGLLEDYASLSGTLAAERDTIDLALSQSARLLVELEDLLEDQGERLGASTEVLARIGRSVDRNHTELRRAVVGQAELYRHAERVFDRERNWLPLINTEEDLGRLISERLATRFAGLCDRADIDDCATPDFWTSELPVRVCLDPLLPCVPPDGEEEGVPFALAVQQATERVPELDEELGEATDPEQLLEDAPAADDGGGEASEEPDDEPDEEPVRGALEELLGGSLGGGR